MNLEFLEEINYTPSVKSDESFWQYINQPTSETYYLLEIDYCDGGTKVIDTSIIKERLEAKAERYNELAQKDKEYWNLMIAKYRYEVKTLEKGFYGKNSE